MPWMALFCLRETRIIMINQILNQFNLYVWAKDKSYKYIFCNEHYAEAAGLDSPNQIVGKTDDELLWRKYADYFRAGDYGVLQGQTRLNSQEVTDTGGIKDILVTESQLTNNQDKCIGIVGSFIDITGQVLVKKGGFYDKKRNRFYLSHEDFDNTYLAGREIEVFKKLLLGYSARQIGECLSLSRKTVESYIDVVKSKLQASSKGEIVATSIQFGLTHILHMQTHDEINTHE